MMRDAWTDGRLQIVAGGTLLERSNLFEWHDGVGQFVPVRRETFEFVHRTQVDPAFGRLICWMLLSSGLEMFVKGVCLLRLEDFRDERHHPAYPTGDIDDWVDSFLGGEASRGVVPVPHYGTLRDFTLNRKHGEPPLLEMLCVEAGASEQDTRLLRASFSLLASSIRNRDVHSYQPGVRDQHYSVVPDLLSRCLSTLVAMIPPDGSATLSSWRRERDQIIESS